MEGIREQVMFDSCISPLTPFLWTLTLCFHAQAALSRVNTTANTDITEGLFDGLMQVMVCGVSTKPK